LKNFGNIRVRIKEVYEENAAVSGFGDE